MKYALVSTIVSLLAGAGLDAGTPAIPDATLAPVESDWNFRIAPYGWLPAVDGDVAIGRFGAPAEISFSDTLDKLDMAFMLVAEASYKRWSLNTDFVYSDFSNEASRAGLPGGQLLRSIHFEYTQWVLTETLGYRVIESDEHRMDVFAGARITSFDGTLTGRFALGFNLQRSADDVWTDPIIGVRGRYELGRGFFCRYNGDIGGFGVSSDLTWQAFVGVGYDVTPDLSVAVGYRGLGTDYSQGPFTVDLIHHGPVIGFEFRF